MNTKPQHGANRRERRRASISVNKALDLLSESHRLARAGEIALAERTARLADQHAKIAERLTNVKQSLAKIMHASMRAAFDFDARDAALREREEVIEQLERPYRRTDAWR